MTIAHELIRKAGCPDCQAAVRIVMKGSFYEAVVTHDDTCPFFRNITSTFRTGVT